MPTIIEKYATIQSSYYSGSISIPLALARPCKQISVRNMSEDVVVAVTIKNITTTVPPLSTYIDYFERDWFNAVQIETALGHNFIMELYRD